MVECGRCVQCCGRDLGLCQPMMRLALLAEEKRNQSHSYKQTHVQVNSYLWLFDTLSLMQPRCCPRKYAARALANRKQPPREPVAALEAFNTHSFSIFTFCCLRPHCCPCRYAARALANRKQLPREPVAGLEAFNTLLSNEERSLLHASMQAQEK